jgi:hypothetical protein
MQTPYLEVFGAELVEGQHAKRQGTLSVHEVRIVEHLAESAANALCRDLFNERDTSASGFSANVCTASMSMTLADHCLHKLSHLWDAVVLHNAVNLLQHWQRIRRELCRYAIGLDDIPELLRQLRELLGRCGCSNTSLCLRL